MINRSNECHIFKMWNKESYPVSARQRFLETLDVYSGVGWLRVRQTSGLLRQGVAMELKLRKGPASVPDQSGVRACMSAGRLGEVVTLWVMMGGGG